MNDVNDSLDAVSQVLWRCFLWGIIFLLVWAFAFWQFRELIVAQAMAFGVTVYQVCFVNYMLMGLFKIVILAFFLLPFVAIRRVLSKRKAAK